ncbi:MAG: iron ABC transporter permease [Thermoprotei archaeon]
MQKLNTIKQRFSRKIFFEIDLVVLAFIFISLFFIFTFLLVPVIMMVETAFLSDGTFSLRWFNNILSSYYINLNPQGSLYTYIPKISTIYVTGIDCGVIFNSLIVASFTTIIASLLGIIIAFVFARYEFPGKKVLRIITLIPLLITPFVNAYVVKKIFDPTTGLINWFLYDILHIIPWRIWLDGLAAVILTQSITYYPIVLLNFYASLMNVDPSLEEQGENLGARGFTLFRKITLPLAFPGLAAGATLVFIFSLEDLGAPIVFQGHPYVQKLMSYQIFSNFIRSTGQRPPEIAALSVVMLVLALAGFLLIKKYVSMRTYAMISRGGRWKARLTKLRLKGLLIVYFIIVPIVIFTILPQVGTVLLAFSTRWNDVFPDGVTLNNLIQIFANPRVSGFVVRSVLYSLAAVIIIILIGIATAYTASRVRLSGITALDALATLPIAIPGIVIAIGYFYFYSQFFQGTFLDPRNPLYFDPAIVLIIAYAVRRMPFTARSIYAGLQQVHYNLEEASMSLGAKRFRTIRSIVMPLISLNVISGAMISFIYSISEVSVSVTLGVLNIDKSPLTVYMANVWVSSVGSAQIAAALGLLLMVIQLSVIAIVTLGFKQRYAFIGV